MINKPKLRARRFTSTAVVRCREEKKIVGVVAHNKSSLRGEEQRRGSRAEIPSDQSGEAGMNHDRSDERVWVTAMSGVGKGRRIKGQWCMKRLTEAGSVYCSGL